MIVAIPEKSPSLFIDAARTEVLERYPEAEVVLEDIERWVIDGSSWEALVVDDLLRDIYKMIVGEENVCYCCGARLATEHNHTFCAHCAADTGSWDSWDRALLQRLGLAEVLTWQALAAGEDRVDLDEYLGDVLAQSVLHRE